jgi:hypothetical protein
VRYNTTTSLAFWDTMEEVFLHCGIQWRSFSSTVGTKEGLSSTVGFNEDNLRMFDKFSYFVSHNAGVFLPSYSTMQEFS